MKEYLDFFRCKKCGNLIKIKGEPPKLIQCDKCAQTYEDRSN